MAATALTFTPRLRVLPRCAECGRVALGAEDGGDQRAATVTEMHPTPRGVRASRSVRLFHPHCLASRRAWHRRRAQIQLGLTGAGATALLALSWLFQLSPLVAVPLAVLGTYAALLEWRDVREVARP
jgi:hypothetical protein